MSDAAEIDLGPLHDYYEIEYAVEDFRAAILAGLSQPQKRILSKYFYDERGSRLFEQITQLPEYYPTRTETALLRAHAAEFAELIGPHASLVEFGSGSSTKVRILLDALEAPSGYVPIDISRDHLIESAKDLAEAYPDLMVVPIAADYTKPLKLPEIANELVRIGFFSGSTIGNFLYAEAVDFLRTAATELGTDNGLLIGVDLKKDEAILHAAYNDAEGITAQFNLNILRHINRELDADFDLDGFSHDARWRPEEGRVEMHLVSKHSQTVLVGGQVFEFAEGESIHTEDSHKYTVEEFHALAAEAGWRAFRHWTDADDLFSIHYLRVA
ncbi:MAG: L-histidine N(alpha)-methyltransferase [Alphaproteobacteria bacterium]|nr:L-histidine N(alpha)-methyltransferase [Alphaproteobacteria bacterium]